MWRFSGSQAQRVDRLSSLRVVLFETGLLLTLLVPQCPTSNLFGFLHFSSNLKV